ERIGHLRRAKDVVDLQAAMKPLGTFGPTSRGRDFTLNSRHENLLLNYLRVSMGIHVQIVCHNCHHSGRNGPMIQLYTNSPLSTIGRRGWQALVAFLQSDEFSNIGRGSAPATISGLAPPKTR